MSQCTERISSILASQKGTTDGINGQLASNSQERLDQNQKSNMEQLYKLNLFSLKYSCVINVHSNEGNHFNFIAVMNIFHGKFYVVCT